MSSVNLTTTSQQVVASCTGRRLVVIANTGPNTAYINVLGGAEPPTASGHPLAVGETCTIKGLAAAREILAGVAEGTAELRVQEA